jgi:uncharacterized protein
MAIYAKISAVGMAGLFTLASLLPAWGQHITAENQSKTPGTISVAGEAIVYVQPDKIIVSLGVETWDAQLDAAKQQNDGIVKRAFAALQKCGVDKKAIQMDQLSVHPTYDYDRNKYGIASITGYSVSNAFTITLTDVSLMESVVTGALEAGVNHVHNVDFQTTELRKHRDKARQLAMKAACEKAKDMAAVCNQAVGRPRQITENAAGGGGCHFWSWSWGGGWYGGGRRDYGMSQNVAVNAPANAAGEGSDAVALGKIAIRANVSVVFELKDQ